MANVSKIEIAKQNADNGMLSVKKGFLGMGGKIVFNETGAIMRPIVKDYVPAEGEKMLRIINLDTEAMARELSANKLHTMDLGNMRLEALLSEDGTVLLLQMFKNADFKWSPVSNLKVINGEAAQTIGRLL